MRFCYDVSIPTTYRVIIIPLCFWAYYLAYLILTHNLFLKKATSLSSYIKKGLISGFALNLYLMHGTLIMDLFNNKGELSDIYIIYINGIFLLSTAIAVFTAARGIVFDSKKDKEFLLLYAPFPVIAFYFSIRHASSGHISFSVMTMCFMAMGIFLSHFKLGIITALFKRVFSKDRNVIAIIFVTAFIVRAAFGINLVYKTTHDAKGYNGYLYASDDGFTYDQTANLILQDPASLLRGEIELWGHWEQFYSLFLAVFYKIIGRNFYLLTCLHSFLGAFIPVFIFVIGKMLFSRIVGLIASILLSFKGGLIFLSAYMGHEAVWLPILYLFISLLTFYFKEPAKSTAFRDSAMGIILGILILFRRMYLYFLPFLCIWEISFFRKGKFIRKLFHLFIIASISLGIISSAFHIFKNEARLVNRDKAMYLWQISRLEPPFQYLGNERLEAMGINFFQDPKGSIRAIAQHPLKFAVLAAKLYPLRVVAYLEAYQFGFFDPIYMVNPAKIKNKFASTLEFYFTLFFLLGLFGPILKKEILNSPIFLILSFHILFFCFALFHPSWRLKEISSPLIYLVGSFGAHMAFKFLTKPR